MSKSVKLVLGAAVVAAVYVGSSWYVGGRVQEEVQKQATVVQDFLNTNSSVALFDQKRSFTISHYERGLFSSTVQYEVELADQDNDLSVTFEDKIYHGPLPIAAGHFTPALAVAEGRVLETETVQAWFEAAQNPIPYQSKTVFGFDGNVTGKAEFAALNYIELDSQTQLQTDPVDVLYDYHKKTGAVKLDLHAPKLSLQDENQLNLVLSRLDVHVASNQNPEQAHYQSTMHLEAVTLRSAETGSLELKGVQVSVDSQSANELLHGTAHYGAQQVWAEGIDWGRLNFDVKLKNIHQGLINEMSVVVDSEEPEDELKLRRLIGDFLSHQPEIEQAKLVWANDSGSSLINTRMSPAPALVEYFKNDVELRDELGQVFTVLDLDISLSRPMLQKLMGEDNLMAAMFDMMFESSVEAGTELGLVTYDGTQVRLLFQFDAAQNTLLLNGKPITEQELVQLFFALQMGGLL